MRTFNLSLIFYPQTTGGYTVICPELESCFSEGKTIEEAQEHVMELIHEQLASEVQNESNVELLVEGLAVPGKLFREIEVEA